MKIKLDHYNLTILINGLNAMREQYSQKVNDYLCNLILRLISICENTKSKRKAKVIFDRNELHVIRIVLIDWRNQFISTGHPRAADEVAELLVKLSS